MSFATVEFDLSMADPKTGRLLTAYAYTVEGINDVNGQPRLLSIGQLVMALCLARASALEYDENDNVNDPHTIVGLMDQMNTISAQLAAMTEIEKTIIDYEENGTNGGQTFTYWRVGSDNPVYANKYYDDVLHDLGVVPNDVNWVYRNGNTPSVEGRKYVQAKDLISDLEAKMDENNSFSQQKMIELQSLTNKRDQCYDMISNILKSLNTALVGNANNF